MKIFVPALLALSSAVAALAAPAKPALAANAPAKIDIDPKARALFLRAAKLYEGLDGLHLEWKTQEFDSDRGGAIELFVASLDYDKAGRLRLEDPDNVEIIVVNDGVTRSAVTNFQRDSEGNPIVRYTSGKIGKDFFASIAISQDLSFSQGLTWAFARWLDGEDGLDEEQLKEDYLDDADSEFRVVLLPAQPFDGQACDLMRINSRDERDHVLNTSQTTYWFARSDGRLMRVQEREVEGQKTTKTLDTQFTEQIFNPQFAPDTFQFTPPKSAVLVEN